MLTLEIEGGEHWDSEREIFTYPDRVVLHLEHSLVALSKWEQKYEKPFLAPEKRSVEEVIGYIDAMILDEEYSPDVLEKLTEKHLEQIHEYMNAKSTATWFNELPGAPKTVNSQVITNELIYYWMFSAQIPIECERWHLNRLFTLIKVFSHKQSKPKKMSAAEVRQQTAALNAKRRAEAGTSG